jgi:hypothetical protein
MDSCMASNVSCFMVTLIIFKNHLLEVGLTHNRETMALRTFTTVGLFHFHRVRGPRMNRNSWKWHLVENPVTYDFTLDLRICDHTTWVFAGVFGRLLDTFFWALTISWSRLLPHVWRDPLNIQHIIYINIHLTLRLINTHRLPTPSGRPLGLWWWGSANNINMCGIENCVMMVMPFLTLPRVAKGRGGDKLLSVGSTLS